MSRLIGMIPTAHGIRKVYDNDPDRFELMRSFDFRVAYHPVLSGGGMTLSGGGMTWSRCDYCGRTNNERSDCLSCGAPNR